MQPDKNDGVYVGLDILMFGCKLNEVGLYRESSIQQGERFPEVMQVETIFTERGQVVKLLLEVYNQPQNSMPSAVGGALHYVNWKQTYLRSALAKSDKLRESHFVTVIPGKGFDLISFRMLVELCQIRIQKARKHRGTQEIEVEGMASAYVDMLFQLFIDNSYDFALFGRLMVNLQQSGVRSSLVDGMLQHGQLHPGTETHYPKHVLGDKFSVKMFLRMVLEYGSSDLLDDLAKSMEKVVKKVIVPTSTLPLVEEWRRQQREDGVKENLLKGGNQNKSFADRIKPLCYKSVKSTPSQLKEARALLAWGHVIETYLQKCKRSANNKASMATPVGIECDGVRVASLDILQVRIWSNVYGGIWTSYPMFPIILDRVTDVELTAILNSDFSVKAEPETKEQVTSSIAQAALFSKISELAFPGQLIDDIPVFVCCDFGSAQRQYFIMEQCAGKKIRVLWDPPHRESRDNLAVSLWILPKGFERFIKLRTTTNVIECATLGYFTNIL
eukprot:g19373.t1